MKFQRSLVTTFLFFSQIALANDLSQTQHREDAELYFSEQQWTLNIPYLEFIEPSGKRLAYQGKLQTQDGKYFTLLDDSVIATPLKSALPDPVVQDEWTAQKKVIRLGNGITLRYVELGEPQQETLILLHGYTDSSRSWQQTVAILQQSYHLIIPDQRGHGDSEKVSCCYAIPDFANDIVLLMDALAVQSATIVGHSMGSFIAQHLALTQPQRVKKLVLIGSAAKSAANQTLIYIWNLVQTFTPPLPESFIAEWTANPTPVDSNFLNPVKQETSQVPIATWQHAGQALLSHDPSALLPAIKIPTLIIWGDQDSVFGEADQTQLRAALPTAIFKTYPGIGHNVQWEQGQRVAEDIKTFVQ